MVGTKTKNLRLPALISVQACGRASVLLWLSFYVVLGFAAASNDITLAQMDHKSWTARDGAPHAMRALAEDPDGTLWIGTESNLFNFDGRAFKPFRPLPAEPDVLNGNINALVIARDGALWAATRHGAVRISHGHAIPHAVVEGKPLTALLGLAVSADGSVWGYGRGKLVRFGADGIDRSEPTPLPANEHSLGGMFIDSSDTLWISQNRRLYQRKMSESAYVEVEAAADFIFGTSEAADGTTWITDFDTKLGFARHQRVDHAGKVVDRLGVEDTPYDILVIPGGSVIVATQFDGLRRVRTGTSVNPGPGPPLEAPERFSMDSGLAGSSPRALLLDREGSLWVANVRGLDRFRAAEFVPFPLESVGAWVLCATPEGVIWAGSSDGVLSKISNGVAANIPNEPEIYHIACAKDDYAWMIDKAEIRMMHADDKPVVLPAIPGAAAYGINRLAITTAHELYAAVQSPLSVQGLWHLTDGKWSRFDGKDVFATVPQTVFVDSKDRVWTGYRDGIVALPFDGEGRIFSSGTPGLDIVLSIFETAQGLFVSGTGGLAVVRDLHLEMLHFAEPDYSRGIGGMIDARNGDLWLNAAPGLVRVRVNEIAAALADPNHLIQAALVTEGEWVGPVPIEMKDTAARDNQGNLWFSTSSGLFHISPEHIDQHLQRPPIISLRSISVDGTRIAAGASIGPDPQTLVIQYLGVNLTHPDDVLYKYRLSGLESDWQDAGHRSEAIYTRLRPGTFTFEVIASNGEGHWSEPLALAPFTVKPNFFQTTWFAVLCAAALLGVIVIVSVLRIRVITRSMRARVEERADERVQIARDLHDTLLQGVQGLLLNVHVAAQKIPSDAEAKPMLEQALTTADRIIIEGRNRISALRSEHVADPELSGALENVCRDLASAKETHYRVVRRGSTNLLLNPSVADEVFHIAREALTNAFRHADAGHIVVVLDYGKRAFELSCEDDGSGFDVDAREKTGHWGLHGMAERAAKLGGYFECRSALAQGTRISVVIAAFRAYHGARWIEYLRGITFRPKFGSDRR